MKHTFIYVIAGIIILYLLKVPDVVALVHGIMLILSYCMDAMMHVKERHPWLYISLPFILFILLAQFARSES